GRRQRPRADALAGASLRDRTLVPALARGERRGAPRALAERRSAARPSAPCAPAPRTFDRAAVASRERAPPRRRRAFARRAPPPDPHKRRARRASRWERGGARDAS